MKPSVVRWARWGWLATTFLMGAALLATAWLGRRRADEAAATLNRGQSELLLEVTRQAIRNSPDPLTAAHLDSVRNAHAGAGLRYLAIRDSNAALVIESGVPASGQAPPGQITSGTPRIESFGKRVRVSAPVRLPRPSGASGAPGSGPGGPPSGPRVRPPMLVLEFEPVLAEGLAVEATRRFLLSAFVTAALLVAAIVFWRLTMLHEEAERRIEQQRRLSALGEMSAVLAHEIKNPLASLKGHAQLLAERLPDGTPERTKADLVVSEARRLEVLTTDLLAFVRPGAIEKRPVDPVALVRTSIADIDASRFTLKTESAPATWPLDEHRMRSALTNVLRNALQASPEGANAEVTVARENGTLVFSVRDRGAGIRPGDGERIFEPFVTTRTTGTGLGLAVARRIVERHDGTISAANHPEGGAVFRLAVPGPGNGAV